jgi:hypothetical protein
MKLNKMLLSIAFVALFGRGCLFGQTLTGAAIPNSIAQRLYFLSLSNMDLQTRRAHLTNAKLPAADIRAAMVAVDTFKTNYEQAVTQYNTAVGNGSGVLSTFQRERANITATAMGDLQSYLSTAGYSALQHDIASANNHMEVPYGPMASSATTASTATNMGCCYSMITSQTVNVISYSPVHATVTFTRTLEGSNTISDPSIKHQGSVTAHIGTRSQTTQGQWLTPNIYINLNASVTLDTNLDSCLMSDPGCSDLSLSSVTCTVGGLVYSSSWLDKLFRLATTNFIHNGNTTNSCRYDLFCPNGNTYATCKLSPVYFVPDGDNLALCQNYLQTLDLVIGGVCTEVGTAVSSSVATNCN